VSAGILGVGTAIPSGRIGVDELARRFGHDPALVIEKLGLLEKPVARRDDEHPGGLAARAARAAMRASGVGAGDIGLVISTGLSRDYPGSWSVALEVIHELQLRGAGGYDLLLGCSATVVALDLARRRADDGDRPVTLIVCAERWTHTLSPVAPIPMAVLAHADGGAACVVGPGAANTLGASSLSVSAEHNATMLIRAGGTREPASAASVLEGRHFRTMRDEGDDRKVQRYVDGYRRVLDEALGGGRPELLLTNQVRPPMRDRILALYGLDAAHTITTYPRLGHLGGADVLVGLDRAAREQRVPDGLWAMASSSNSAFAAISARGAGVAFDRNEG
jgi:acetoacetyl-CoA synthase